MSAYQRLKDLLLDDERADLARASERIEALERRRMSPRELPALIDAASRGESSRELSRALAAPVADALGDAVLNRRQSIVDALFPVIGPAIRKAIAEALRGMVADLNAALESSFTPRGLRWRIESWRTGAPYAQVVLRHTLRWRVEHLFLIEPHSGLVLHRESAPGLADLDSDAIAGMLTAIGEFVQDSVGREPGATLASANVGEHLLWVDDGPRARLACFIRGAPPAALRELLRQRLEGIHERFADPLAQLQAGATGIDAALDQALDLPGIDRDARALDTSPPPSRARWPALLLALAALAGLLAWGIHEWRWSQRMQAVSATLRDWPGLAVQHIARRDGGIHVLALRDPLADDPLPALTELLPTDAPIVIEARGYVATDAAIVARRARSLLQLPVGVDLSIDGGTLVLAGEMPELARENLLAAARMLPGVGRVDAERLLAREPRLRAELAAVAEALARRRVDFAGDADAPADPAAIAPMVDELRRALALAREIGVRIELRAWGATDASGTPARNATLRAARARWLAETLSAALGHEVFADLEGAASDPGVTLSGRVAGVRMELEGTEGR